MFKNVKTISVTSKTMQEALSQIGYHEKMHVNEKLNKKVCEWYSGNKVTAINPKNWYTDFSDGQNTYQVKFRKNPGITLDKFLNNIKSDYIIYVCPNKDNSTFTFKTFKTKELQKTYNDCLKGNFPKNLKIEVASKNNMNYFKVTI